VSYTINSVFIKFDNDVALTIESSFEHRTDLNGGQCDDARPPLEYSRLMQLIAHTVEMASREDRGTLVLNFSGGHTVRCFDDSVNYECYRIEVGTSELVV